MAPLSAPVTYITSTAPFQTGKATQWGPDSIGTIVFGVLMFCVGLVALWQGHQRKKQHEHEQGSDFNQEERTAGALRVVMVDFCSENESERVDWQDGQEQERQQSSTAERNERAREKGGKGEGSNVQIGELQGDGNNVDEEFEPRRGNTIRTDTDWTLVGTDDEDEAKGKNVED